MWVYIQYCKYSTYNWCNSIYEYGALARQMEMLWDRSVTFQLCKQLDSLQTTEGDTPSPLGSLRCSFSALYVTVMSQRRDRQRTPWKESGGFYQSCLARGSWIQYSRWSWVKYSIHGYCIHSCSRHVCLAGQDTAVGSVLFYFNWKQKDGFGSFL